MRQPKYPTPRLDELLKKFQQQFAKTEDEVSPIRTVGIKELAKQYALDCLNSAEIRKEIQHFTI